MKKHFCGHLDIANGTEFITPISKESELCGWCNHQNKRVFTFIDCRDCEDYILSIGDTITLLVLDEFRKKAGFSISYFERLIVGNETITQSIAAKLSLYLGCSTAYWLDLERK